LSNPKIPTYQIHYTYYRYEVSTLIPPMWLLNHSKYHFV
jgi:hypothetical protein